MPTLTKDQILSLEDRPTLTVSVPEWGGDVVIRKLSARQKAIMESYWKFDDAGKFIPESGHGDRARLVALSCINEDGTLMFSVADAIALDEKSFEAVRVIADAAAKFNGFDKKDTVKNSPETTGG